MDYLFLEINYNNNLYYSILSSQLEQKILDETLQQSLYDYKISDEKNNYIIHTYDVKPYCGSELLDCSICQENLSNTDACIETECNHWFHDKCFSEWIMHKPQCCICRTNLSKIVDTSICTIWPEEELFKLKLRDLKDICRRFGIKISGSKRTLVDRIIEFQLMMNEND